MKTNAIVKWAFAAALLLPVTRAYGAEPNDLVAEYRKTIQPILEDYCYGCHGYGLKKGGLQLDRATSDAELLQDQQLWWAVLKNLRAGIMPPPGKDRPSPEQTEKVNHWIKTAVFGVDPLDPDPGQVTIRRLNRLEYQNTIRDLMGVDFNAELVFPPDDTGFGFDNIGDALSLSQLLLEKYFRSAKKIVHEAVPTVTRVIPTLELTGRDFETSDGSSDGSRMSYYKPATVARKVRIEYAGNYKVHVEVRLHGSFDFDPGRCEVTFLIDGHERYQDQYAWDERKSIHYRYELDWEPGEHDLVFDLKPLTKRAKPAESKSGRRRPRPQTFVNFHVLSLEIEGPVDPPRRVHPKNYKKFFPRDVPPTSAEARRLYAREILQEFAERALRRPVDDATTDRLVKLAESQFQRPDKTFEAGVAQAMTAVLASPQFLFRIEPVDPSRGNERFPLVDEYALASRLSYFLWSTSPDEQLMGLAARSKLRQNLKAQVERMLADPKSQEFVGSFVGQWLRSRDVEHVSINALAALGYQDEMDKLRATFRRRFSRNPDAEPLGDEEWNRVRTRLRELGTLRDRFDKDTRTAMRRETEMLFDYIIREDRSVLELIDCDYTFVNEKLADLYDIPGIEGNEMRRVTLEDSRRGGILTQGTMLTVTSNPSRTSPVKRGLFILENILGLPSPPPPGNVPELEEAARKFGDREPPLREVLAAHRESPLCASCHARMDPLGIALENFNALGMWRDAENGEPIDASGELITGKAFKSVRDLKKILATDHRADFFRCMTQKLMTYATGRGLECFDEYTVDEIVAALEKNNGRFSALLHGVIQSAPFQRQRRSPDVREPARALSRSAVADNGRKP